MMTTANMKRGFLIAIGVVVFFGLTYHLKSLEADKLDAIAQLNFQVNSLFKELRNLKDLITIRGVYDELGSGAPSASFRLAWLRFLRRCSDERVRFLLLREDLVRSVDATRHPSAAVLTNFSHLVVFRDQVGILERILGAPEFGVSGRFNLDAHSVRGVSKTGAVVKSPIGQDTTPSPPKDSVLYGFVILDGTPSRVNVSILYERRNDDPQDGGYYWVPWSPRGVAMAFSLFETRSVDVEGFEETFQVPANISQYLWELEAAEFIACDEERNAAFAKKSIKSVTLHKTKDKDRIRRTMRLIVTLRKTMASWRKRNWIFAGTLLGWYRQCSVIPHDLDMDTAQWIDDYEDWMIDYFRTHKLLKLYVKFGLKDDSLEFKLGDKKWYTIDLFWMYSQTNQSWVGIQTFDGHYTKKVSFYPPIGRICSADLHEYLVYVPCDSWSIIRTEYGAEKWFQGNPRYNYKKDAYNWRVNGSWTAKQWKGGAVYKIYQ